MDQKAFNKIQQELESINSRMDHMRKMVRDFNHLRDRTIKILDQVQKGHIDPEELNDLNEMSDHVIEKYLGDNKSVN